MNGGRGMTEHTTSTLKALSRQERFDFRLSRLLPKLSGRANRAVYRFSGGRVGGAKRGIPIGLLTMTGRRSGKSRTVPVMYLDDGTRFLVVASNGGFDAPPAWYVNLKADPRAAFRTRSGTAKVVARDLTDAERTDVWGRLVLHNPLWGAFQSCTERQTTVVALERSQPDGSV
jgi:F420H(2)-dependent quinone reductase